MSSTHRGAVRSPNDFYRTDPDEIVRFLKQWSPTFLEVPRRILDPSAGGLTERMVLPPDQKKINKYLAGRKDKISQNQMLEDKEAAEWLVKNSLTFEPSEMSYPTAFTKIYGDRHHIDTIDIRENSKAEHKFDFLGYGTAPLAMDWDIVITNPPFSLAIEFIKKALMVVKPAGYVVMLLRLNFFGSEERNKFFLDGHMPDFAYVHSRRLGFTPDGKTDSIEYMHAIWRKSDFPCHETKLRVLPY